MKKNKRLKQLATLIATAYVIIAALFLANMLSLDGRFAQKEQAYIKDIEGKIKEVLAINLSEMNGQLDDLTNTYAVEITIDDGVDVLYNTVNYQIGDELFGSANKFMTLIESKGQFDNEGKVLNVWYVIYKMPEGAFYQSFFNQQIFLIIIAFALLSTATIFLSRIFIKPFRKIRKAIEQAQDFNFEQIEGSDDAINKEFGDFTDKLQDGIHAVSRQHTELETQLQVERERLNNTLSVSRSFIHDFKTPLHQLILENDFFIFQLDETNAEVKQLVEINNDVIGKLIHNLNDVLRLMKDDVYTEIQAKEAVSIESMIIETVGLFKPTIRLNKLKVNISVDDMEDIFVNKPTLQLLIHNLISNMVQYAKPESKIIIEVFAENEEVQFNFHNESSLENTEYLLASEQIFNVVMDQSDGRHEFSGGNGLFLIKDLATILSGSYVLKIDGESVDIIITIQKEV
ncbi:sensor histidine kinase [Erysipelothrix sp. HDW6C]|uniref:sensor histidine kinase n=1 Tax=Erysipelothrix sp. HDW6C TaxID=2714930 RepID=UPI00140B93A0|nr:sensor histidine kinase [Erysipelothrix sp. HDW6C]QIK69181.1 sensor histidine kinase [Erysipelothrix sp. HDW6C]